MTSTNSTEKTKPVVLFLCTHNRCRSQLAEGLLRHLYGDQVEVTSAGSEPAEQVNASVIAVLKELDIDVSKQYPKHFKDTFLHLDPAIPVDYVVTLCSNNGEGCPRLTKDRPVKKYIHHVFEDPSQMAPEGDDGLLHFRRIRDEILDYLKTMPLFA